MISKKRVKNNKLIRSLVQIFFFILILIISVNHQLAEKGITIPFVATASLHAICPFGGVVSIYSLLTEGILIQKIHESSFILLGIVLILGLLFGSVFCGWICPLGTAQEFVGTIGKKLFKNKYNNFIPYKFDKYLRYLRYVVLVWVIFIIAYTGKLAFSEIDPYHAMFNFWSSEITISGIIVLTATLLASLFIERPWCKYTCPLGAFLGLTNFIRIFKISRNKTTCISCKACNSNCPMNIDISDKDTISNHQCISCLKCTSEISCPINDTLLLKPKSWRINGKSVVLATIILVAIFGGIYSSDIAGLWKTESTKVARTISTGESAGQKNPSDIKGSFSFDDISRNFDIPVADLQLAFEIQNVNIEDFKCKDLETYYSEELEQEIGTESVRLFVSLYKGIDYKIIDGTYLPNSAVNLLLDKKSLSEEQINYIKLHSASLPN